MLLGVAFLPAALLPLLDPALAAGSGPSPLAAALRAPLAAAAWAAALGLACAVPDPLEDAGLLWAALGVGGGLALAGAGAAVAAGGFAAAPVGGAHLWTAAVGHALGLGFLYAAGVLLALRSHPGRRRGAGERVGADDEGGAGDRAGAGDGGGASDGGEDVAGLGLLAVALALPAAVPAGMGVAHAGRALATGDAMGALAAGAAPLGWLLVAGLWGRNLVAARDGSARVHRRAFDGLLGCLAAGALFQAAVPGALPGSSLLDGLAVVGSAGLIGYGILRHDLAGMDVVARWGASRGDDGGSRAGGAAAVSERRSVAIYKALVRRFADDGGLSQAEEQALANLADQLDLEPGRAFALRMEEDLDGDGTGDGEGPEPAASAARAAGGGEAARAAAGGGNGAGPEAAGPGADGDGDPGEPVAAVAEAAADGPVQALQDASDRGPRGEATAEGRADGTRPGDDGAGGETVVEGGGTTAAGNGAPERAGVEASGDGTDPDPEPPGDGPADGGAAASADATPATSRAGDGAGADASGGDGTGGDGGSGGGEGDGSDGPGSGEEGLEGRMDLRRNAETGEVEMVIHETPWGDVRVDLGEVPRGD